MIKDNQKRLNHFHVVLDACVIACAYALAWFIVNGTPWFNVTGHNKSAMAVVYLAAGVLIVPFYFPVHSFRILELYVSGWPRLLLLPVSRYLRKSLLLLE